MPEKTNHVKNLKEGILTQKQIGKIFNVSHITISDIKRNKTWKDV